ncbi:MAG TPA: hypothetical protein VGG99_08695 [Acetobacteraceae bacterium]|jgi:hypothetical protein
MADSKTQHSGFGNCDGKDDNVFTGIGPQMLGLNLPFDPFVSLVDALIPNPIPFLPIAAGDNGPTPAQSNMFWTYDQITGLHVETAAGYLSGAPGTGGFNLNVLPDGAWALQFDGTNTVIGANAGEAPPAPPPPPAGNAVLYVTQNGADGGVNGTAGHLTINGDGSASDPVVGYDTISGGVDDYMIGGDGTGGAGPGGDGNCAIYLSGPGSVLVDMENGNGYGGSAQGDVMSNMNQVRGSAFSNVLIGKTTGTDLKSGGNDSLLVSTGGKGFELRPDGYGNILVSTVGADVFRFDPTHGWALGDDNIALGFNVAHGDTLDLSLIGSNFHDTTAAGYNAATGTGNINDYVRFVNEADGDHLLFSPTGNVQSAGIELLDMKLTYGLNAASLYQSHNLLL